MKRFLEQEMNAWRQRKQHLPLILRGARQVGKSYLATQFGQKYFINTVVVNFEFQPQYKTLFQNLDPQSIVSQLEYLTGQSIQPDKTLLFLDEIQECPQAILALRYFKEQMPALHVIAAGSLLEFVLQQPEFRMPVGRVQFMQIYPLSFKEFLIAHGHTKLKELIEESDLAHPIPEVVHRKLLDLVQLYFILGGMPAVSEEYLQNGHHLLSCQRLQGAILTTYRNDFGKYSNLAKHKYLEQLFIKAPELITKQFRYAEVSREMQSRDIKEALENLYHAGLLHQVFATSAKGLPLNALRNEKKFKLLFLDIGLALSTIRVTADTLLSEQIHLVTKGNYAEQFVGQELIANSDPYFPAELHYWAREARSSSAEVDYVINLDHAILPVEVKAGSTGRMKSMQQFMAEHNSKYGIRVSILPLAYERNIISIPFYMVSEIPRLLRESNLKPLRK